MDYRRWYDDSGMLYAYDLEDAQGRDVVVQIEKAWGGEVIGEKGRKSKKPLIKFVGRDKTLALNKTNGKAIAKLYGKDGTKWAGKWIALYVSTVDYDGETRDCIRIRPRQPELKKNTGRRPGPAPQTQGELEQALKDQGLIDETHQDRVNRVESELSPEELDEIKRIEAEEAAQS